MNAPVTILVFDSRPMTGVRKALESGDRLVVVTSNPRLIRHALNTMVVGVLIFDIGVPSIDIKTVSAIATHTSPGIQIILLGGALLRKNAQSLIDSGYGTSFLARPYSLMDIKKSVREALAEYAKRPPGRGESGRRVIRMSDSQVESDSKIMGPDPEHYLLQDLIGIGGTGTVFRAYDKFLNLEVAIKIINPGLLDDPDVLASFKDEARIAMLLSHKGIVRIYNFSTFNECYYIVMEVVHGQTLYDVIVENGALSIETVCQILLACAEALEYAHQNNVVHNDLKPENIFITEASEVKIIDFGTAVLKTMAKEAHDIVGTPEYMSPEQLRGGVPDPTNDIYALGIVTYLMLTGKFPFPIDITTEMLLTGFKPNFSGIPDNLAQVLSYATEFEASNRYQSVTEFVNAVLAASGIPEGYYSTDKPVVITRGSENLDGRTAQPDSTVL
jgi:predicted Ser/Thr protein kinase